MSRDADYNTPAHIDRDEARSLLWGGDDYVEWWNKPDAPNPIHEPRWMCTACTQTTSCDEHRDAQAEWDAMWTA